MTASFDIAVFIGSLRRASYTRSVIKALAARSPISLKMEIVEIGELSLYNQDLEAAAPPPWLKLRARIKAADGILFATPEYNRSIPAVLKNAIDIGSRPVGSNSWAGKPGAIISVSPGAMGAFGANQHLRQSLSSLNVPLLPGPEAYIGGVAKLLDNEGSLAPPTAEFLDKFLLSFAAWISRIKA